MTSRMRWGNPFRSAVVMWDADVATPAPNPKFDSAKYHPERIGVPAARNTIVPDVKVLAPKSLLDRILEKLRDGLRAQQ